MKCEDGKGKVSHEVLWLGKWSAQYCNQTNLLNEKLSAGVNQNICFEIRCHAGFLY